MTASDNYLRYWRQILGCLGLFAAVLIAYWPALHGTPLWDDDGHMTNAQLRSSGGLIKIWIQPGATQQYYPLIHTAFWLQDRLWGADAFGHHLVNLMLHICAVFLLWRILRELQTPGAALAAALFALHPVQTESVAWISELKNTLSACLYLLSALVYLRFDLLRSRRHYVWALLLFLLALFSKSITASLPAALLVVFWWRRGRIDWRRDVLPLLPFFGFGLAAGLTTIWVEHHFIGARGPEFGLSFIQRMLIAGRSFWFYLGTLLWPQQLSFIYPRWQIDASVWWQYFFPLAAIAMFIFAWFLRWRGPLAAMLFFGGTLFPALGFINVYPFRFSFVANHFQYLASIGPITLASACVSLGARRYGWAVAVSAAVILLPIFGFLTWSHSHEFANVETLWRSTLAKNPGCWLAENNLGLYLQSTGRFEEAVVCHRQAVKLQPQDANFRVNLGNSLLQTQQITEAIACFQSALELQPVYVDAHVDLGSAFLQAGRLSDAESSFQHALDLQPNHAEACNNLGNVFQQMGRFTAAVESYRKAIEIRPAYAEAHNNLGNALLASGQHEQAIACYQWAIELKPGYAEAHYNLANLLRDRGDIALAVAHFNAALVEQPDSISVLNNLAWILATCPDDALREGARALKLARRAASLLKVHPVVLHTLAAAFAEAGDYAEAAGVAERARELARAQGNAGLEEMIHQQALNYKSGKPYRDHSLTSHKANVP